MKLAKRGEAAWLGAHREVVEFRGFAEAASQHVRMVSRAMAGLSGVRGARMARPFSDVTLRAMQRIASPFSDAMVREMQRLASPMQGVHSPFSDATLRAMQRVESPFSDVMLREIQRMATTAAEISRRAPLAVDSWTKAHLCVLSDIGLVAAEHARQLDGIAEHARAFFRAQEAIRAAVWFQPPYPVYLPGPDRGTFGGERPAGTTPRLGDPSRAQLLEETWIQPVLHLKPALARGRRIARLEGAGPFAWLRVDVPTRALLWCYLFFNSESPVQRGGKMWMAVTHREALALFENWAAGGYFKLSGESAEERLQRLWRDFLRYLDKTTGSLTATIMDKEIGEPVYVLHLPPGSARCHIVAAAHVLQLPPRRARRRARRSETLH